MQHWLPFGLNNSTPYLNSRRFFLKQEHQVQIFFDQKGIKYILPSSIRASVETRPNQLHNLLQFSPALPSLTFYGPSPWASQGSAIHVFPVYGNTSELNDNIATNKVWRRYFHNQSHNWEIITFAPTKPVVEQQGSDLLQRDGFFTFFSSCWTFFGKQCWPGWLFCRQNRTPTSAFWVACVFPIFRKSRTAFRKRWSL